MRKLGHQNNYFYFYILNTFYHDFYFYLSDIFKAELVPEYVYIAVLLHKERVGAPLLVIRAEVTVNASVTTSVTLLSV